jgi:hypothetical protein
MGWQRAAPGVIVETFHLPDHLSVWWPFAMQRSRLIAVFAGLFLIYLVSYLFVTFHGKYEPYVIGFHDQNSYAWAPRGFVHDYKWNRFHLAFYLPLYCVDVQFWHTRAKSQSGLYPLDRPPTLVPTKAHSAPPTSEPVVPSH